MVDLSASMLKFLVDGNLLMRGTIEWETDKNMIFSWHVFYRCAGEIILHLQAEFVSDEHCIQTSARRLMFSCDVRSGTQVDPTKKSFSEIVSVWPNEWKKARSSLFIEKNEDGRKKIVSQGNLTLFCATLAVYNAAASRFIDNTHWYFVAPEIKKFMMNSRQELRKVMRFI